MYISKIFNKIPYSGQKYMMDIYSFFHKSFFGSIIKTLTIRNITKNVPFYYLKYFSTDSLKKGYIKISDKVGLGKGFLCPSPGRVEIGDYTYLAGDNCLVPSDLNYIKIGKFCSIAHGVNIIAGYYHDYNRFTTSPKLLEDYQLGAPIEIGNDVWIGRNAIIMKGVKIGDGCVIGAGSIVNKSTPPYAIVAGVPAKIIKYRFSKKKIDYLLKAEWWNKSLEEIKNNIKEYEKYF